MCSKEEQRVKGMIEQVRKKVAAKEAQEAEDVFEGGAKSEGYD